MLRRSYVTVTYAKKCRRRQQYTVRIPYVVWAIALAFATAEAQTEPVAARPTAHVDSTRLASLLDTTTRRDTTAAADSASHARVRRPSTGCWRAQPQPRCLGFLVTDFGLEFPMYSTRRQAQLPNRGEDDFGPRIVWSLGLMRNVGGDATGPVFSLIGETAATGLSRMAEWRYRRWLGATSAVDVGIGYKTTYVWQPGAGDVRASGMTAMAGWTPNRWIGVSARMDVVGANGQTHRAIMLGVQSTRGSELLTKLVVVEIWRALLARIGVEWESE
jgi:hypothetical protein